MPRTACVLLAALVVALTATRPASAQRRPDDGLAFHIRTTEPRLRALIAEGLRASPTFRAIVDRLMGTDVIVMLHCDPAAPPQIDGRLTIASKSGGYRYLMVRVRAIGHRGQMLGLLAHELRHAVEIADTAAIVDSASLAREYERLGYERRVGSAGPTFDTDAAVDAGYQVLAEVTPRRRGAIIGE
jgi:hypothetical protein